MGLITLKDLKLKKEYNLKEILQCGIPIVVLMGEIFCIIFNRYDIITFGFPGIIFTIGFIVFIDYNDSIKKENDLKLYYIITNYNYMKVLTRR